MKWPVSIVWHENCSSNWFCPQKWLSLIQLYLLLAAGGWCFLPLHCILRWANELLSPVNMSRLHPDRGILKMADNKGDKNTQTLGTACWRMFVSFMEIGQGIFGSSQMKKQCSSFPAEQALIMQYPWISAYSMRWFTATASVTESAVTGRTFVA